MKNPKGFSRLVYFICLVVSCVTSFSSYANISLNDLRLKLSHYVTQQLEQAPQVKWEVEIRGLDPRIKLQNCPQEISFRLAGKQRSIERLNTFHTTCKAKKGNTLWALYIPVQVKRMEPVLVAQSNLAKGHILTQDDLRVDFLDTYSLRGQFYTNPAGVIGSKIKKPIRSEQVIKSRNICLVCKEDPVTIEAVGTGLFIKTDGIALSDGIAGDSIQVKNKRSGQKVVAQVVAPGRVQIKI